MFFVEKLGELALSRENWFSPGILATTVLWEARTVGWFEVDRRIPPSRRTSVAALRPLRCGKVNRGGQPPIT